MIKSASRRVVGFITLASLGVSCGCSLMVNPNYDELSYNPATMTPSERGVREAQVTVVSQQVRPFEAVPCAAHTGSCTHGPLYFEDPFELRGSDDDQFAWTLEEPFYYMLGPIRYGFNLAFWPISAIASPPWVPVAVADVGTTSQETMQEEEVAATTDDEEVTP